MNWGCWLLLWQLKQSKNDMFWVEHANSVEIETTLLFVWWKGLLVWEVIQPLQCLLSAKAQ